MTVAFQFLRGNEITPFIDEIGGLRIAVFREFPYLYDGTLDYERPYLERYAASGRSLIVTMRHEGRLIGATSCQPLADEMVEFRAPFEKQHLATGDYFYFGESIILPPWRGRGTGKSFFRFREKHAASFRDYRFTTFCAVERSPDDPQRPADYRPLDGFWERNGYQKRPDLPVELSWKEPGGGEEIPHALTFWTKPLSAHSSEELAS
jgi:GNAT superfamily N-acetyltransferase